MKKFFKSEALSIGLAMFSMFFGAGNVIFPLAVGQYAGDKNFFALLGLIITAAIMPIAGVIAMILYDGNYRQFFGRLGRIPGFVLALIIISLLGPLGSTPRCIALSYATLKSSFLEMPFALFSALSCGLIFFCTRKKSHMLALLGWVLTPLLLLAMFAIIVIGLFSAHEISSIDQTQAGVFFHGLREGYNTMDLLAAFFFSSTIVNILRMRRKEESSAHIPVAFRASMVGALLLALSYIGFSYLAAFHGQHLLIGKDQLLAAIAMKIAGSSGGLLVCITIALACLTTAIALLSAFTDFIHKEVFQERVKYEAVLLGSLALTFFISTFEFSGISSFLGPILQICYPGLIVLTVLNILHRLTGLKILKLPVFLTFGYSAVQYFL